MDTSSRHAKAVLAIYVAGFGIGFLNHARDFVQLGWRPYKWAAPALEIFWTSLIGLDLLAIVTIVSGQGRAGLSLAVAIIALDVAANTYAWQVTGIAEFSTAVPFQSAFFGFVVGSVPFLWTSRSGN